MRTDEEERIKVAGLRYYLQARRTALLIVGTLIATVPTLSQSNPSGPSREQAVKLREAERIADSVMTQMHKTLDFEPLLTEIIAPDMLKALRERYKLNGPSVSDRDLLRLYTANLTVLYLTPLLRFSLKMGGLKAESEEDLPPDVRSAVEGLRDSRSANAEGQSHDLVGRAQNARATMLKYIRADVFASPAYRSFVESYRSEAKVGNLEGLSGGESAYIVRREGFEFAMVERGGVLKIATAGPAWLD
jgi:hypothetical protein